MIRKSLLACGLLALCLSAEASMSGKGEFGLVFNRGNSESEAANARLEMKWERERWENETTARAVYARDTGTTSANRFTIANSINYLINERSYTTGAVRYDRDRFSSFRYQSSVAVGYGRRLLVGEVHRLTVEIGPGWQFAEIRDTGEKDNQAIARGVVNYRWQIADSTRLTNRLLVESGSSNSFVENALSLGVAINSRLSLSTGVTLTHNTDVEPGRKKTDTLTTVNLVYNFGTNRD
ncbi:MAG: DUF481 domain-containing protein [Wenzhouxiangella sp.]